jgi:hypothetical protein
VATEVIENMINVPIIAWRHDGTIGRTPVWFVRVTSPLLVRGPARHPPKRPSNRRGRVFRWFSHWQGLAAIEVSPRRQHSPLARLLIAGFAWSGLLDRVQSSVNLRQKAFDLITLVRAGIVLQP